MEIIGHTSCSLVILLWLSAFANGEGNTLSTLAKLRNDLLSNYDRRTRPVFNRGNTTVVTVFMFPLYLQGLDEKKHIFTLDAYMHLMWIDEHIKWDPKNYDNIRTIIFDHEELWLPKMIALWSSPTSSLDPYARTPMAASYDGNIVWYPTAVFRTQCILDYTNYPNDQQTCYFNLSSLSFDGSPIKLYPGTEDVDTSFLFDTNPIWTLVGSKSKKSEMWHLGDICYTFYLKRRMPFGGDVEWALSVVSLLLALSMFWMPPERGKKLTLGLTSLLILFGELLFFTLTSPSYTIAMYTARMIQPAVFAVLSALLLEIIVLNLTRITEFPPPGVLLNFLSGPARRFFCFCPQDPKKTTLQKDWYIIALGFDRILFVLYVIVFVSIKTWV